MKNTILAVATSALLTIAFNLYIAAGVRNKELLDLQIENANLKRDLSEAEESALEYRSLYIQLLEILEKYRVEI